MSDDYKLWEQYKKGIKPLSPDEQTERREQKKVPQPKKSVHQKSHDKNPMDLAEPSKTEPDLRRPLSRQRLRKTHVEAELDLHGMTQTQAYNALLNFLTHSYNRGRRVVLVITGKGLARHQQTQGRERGILKQEVPKWLNSSPLRSIVAEFTESAIKDGGSGALYVFLRKKR